MSAVYRIPDEPTGNYASKIIVNPFWVLLIVMLAGTWLAAPLFALNAVLLRGPTWRREVLLTVLMLLGAPLILYALLVADREAWLPSQIVRYLVLSTTAWKLALAYWIFFLQQNAFALYEYFAGTEQAQKSNGLGLAALVVGTLVRSGVVVVFESPFWRVMVN